MCQPPATGDRFAVRRHDGAADDDVAVPVAVGPLALEITVGEVGRRDELVATGPTPALASSPWHTACRTPEAGAPMAIDSGEAFTGFGIFAATSRCSLGITASPPRGTRRGHGKIRSPAMMREVCVMSWTQR